MSICASVPTVCTEETRRAEKKWGCLSKLSTGWVSVFVYLAVVCCTFVMLCLLLCFYSLSTEPIIEPIQFKPMAGGWRQGSGGIPLQATVLFGTLALADYPRCNSQKCYNFRCWMINSLNVGDQIEIVMRHCMKSLALFSTNYLLFWLHCDSRSTIYNSRKNRPDIRQKQKKPILTVSPTRSLLILPSHSKFSLIHFNYTFTFRFVRATFDALLD